MVTCASLQGCLNKYVCIKFKTVLKSEMSLKWEEIVHIDLANLEGDREEVKENFQILILGD